MHNQTFTNLDEFTRAYIEAMCFSEMHCDNPEMEHKSFDDLSQVCADKIVNDCQAFQQAYGHLFTDENCLYKGCSPTAYAGHDFWFSRNHAGVGYWDGDWANPAGTILDEAAKAAKSMEIYVGDDGQIYC